LLGPALLGGVLLPLPAGAAPTGPSADPGTVLVGYAAGTTSQEAAETARSVGAIDTRVVGDGTHVLKLTSGRVSDATTALRRRAAVRYAEPDFILHADAIPNDPSFNLLWGMRNTGQTVNGTPGTATADIDAAPAWSVTTGSVTVMVGVVDTGIAYTHPDLAANVWSNPGGINGCPAGTRGFNAITNTCDPADDNSHGSHVSGTIGAVGNNGIGVAGVNWTTRIVGLKFLDASGSGTTSNAILAIDWAVRAKQAGVNIRALNNSWGGGAFSQALLDEINKAGANDILFVASAGNDASNNDAVPHFPSSYGTANEIAVAATDQDDNLASFSNFGLNSVDLGAPGVNTFSTVLAGAYDFKSGTSMATPHVTGAATLVLASGNRTTASLKSVLFANVDPDASLAGRTKTGGRLNVCRAITGCVPTHTTSPGVPPGGGGEQ